MSGSAGGLILLPLAAAAIPVLGLVLVGSAVIAAGKAAFGAAQRYEESRRHEREMIRQSGVSEGVDAFREAIRDEMNRQTQLNAEASKRMTAEMDRCRSEMSEVLSDNNPLKYRQYLDKISQSRASLRQSMAKMQDEFLKGYTAKITENVKAVGEKINDRAAKGIEQLRSMQASEAQKKEKAKELAASLIKEAESLLSSMTEDFAGKYFLQGDTARLSAELASAQSQFDAGSYEASIAVAKSVSLGAMQGVYEADRMKQEWENYHKHSLMIASEIVTYMEAQAEITPEMKEQLDKASGKKLSEELEGLCIGDYTDVQSTGETLFDSLLNRANEMKEKLEAADPSNMTNAEMKRAFEELNDGLYPKAMTAVHNALQNINEAYTRRGLGEKIIDFFKGHNFSFSGSSYEDDDDRKTLYIGLENGITGEELVITLAPDLTNQAAVGTKVEIDQINGDGNDEERKAVYREIVELAATNNNSIPGVRCNINCDRATVGKLSVKTGLKEKIAAR